jgi:hypothetical protein
MNGIISLKKHVDVEHFVIAKKLRKLKKCFYKCIKGLLYILELFITIKFIYVILYEYYYLIIIISYFSL